MGEVAGRGLHDEVDGAEGASTDGAHVRDGPPRRRPGRPLRGRRFVAVGLFALLVLVFGVGQVALPPLAGEAVSERVGHYGHVVHVSVRALPAVELLWGAADRIAVSAGNLAMSPSDLLSLERSIGGVATAELRAASIALSLPALGSGTVTLRDVRLRKRGDALLATAVIRREDVHIALPVGAQLEGIESVEGVPVLAVSGQLLAARIEAHVQVSASEGRIVGEPLGLPLASLARLTIFSAPQVWVESVRAEPTVGGYALTVTARALS